MCKPNKCHLNRNWTNDSIPTNRRNKTHEENKNLIKKIDNYADDVSNKIKSKENTTICDIPITHIEKISTGKYDDKFWKNFPDEGIRFYLNSKYNHITVRNSGTESKIRIFVQYHIGDITKQNLLEKKLEFQTLVTKIQNEFRNNINF